MATVSIFGIFEKKVIFNIFYCKIMSLADLSIIFLGIPFFGRHLGFSFFEQHKSHAFLLLSFNVDKSITDF